MLAQDILALVVLLLQVEHVPHVALHALHLYLPDQLRVDRLQLHQPPVVVGNEDSQEAFGVVAPGRAAVPAAELPAGALANALESGAAKDALLFPYLIHATMIRQTRRAQQSYMIAGAAITVKEGVRMRRIPATCISIIVLLALVLAVGCGGSGGGSTGTTPGSKAPFEVYGSWIVEGQSAMTYSLTLYPDNTFGMTYGGKQLDGRFEVSGATITLSPDEGSAARLEVKGDTLVEDAPGGVTWIRI